MDCVSRIFEQGRSYANAGLNTTEYYYVRDSGQIFKNNVAYLSAKIALTSSGAYLVSWSVTAETGEVINMRTGLSDVETYDEARYFALLTALRSAKAYDPEVTCFIGDLTAGEVLRKIERKVNAIIAEREKEAEEIE